MTPEGKPLTVAKDQIDERAPRNGDAGGFAEIPSKSDTRFGRIPRGIEVRKFSRDAESSASREARRDRRAPALLRRLASRLLTLRLIKPSRLVPLACPPGVSRRRVPSPTKHWRTSRQWHPILSRGIFNLTIKHSSYNSHPLRNPVSRTAPPLGSWWLSFPYRSSRAVCRRVRRRFPDDDSPRGRVLKLGTGRAAFAATQSR